jgi:Gas vesicle synthesis protein GvpO
MMSESKREEAQRRRAEGRRRRREPAPDEPKQDGAALDDSRSDEPLETVKHAAKVAAAAAAVGAAVGAARAIAGDGEHEHEDEHEDREPDAQPEPREAPEPAAEQEQQRPPEREEPQEPQEPEEHEDEPRTGASPGEARRVVESAREQIAALLGKEPDSVSGLDRNGDGWLVTLEVVELARIPESTDVLASYEVELDTDRKLVRYQRRRRYYRSQANEEALT